MSRELQISLRLLTREQKESPEFHLVDCGAPTMAGMKAASMFNVQFLSGQELTDWVRRKNLAFLRAGLRFCVLNQSGGNAMILVFRKRMLGEVLKDPEVRGFLSECGYSACGLYAYFSELKVRVRSCGPGSFPHEIGIFLGYPLCDVRGFITMKGQGCKARGLWKVYGDVEKTRAVFRKYQRCREVYWKLWITGQRTLTELVAAC